MKNATQTVKVELTNNQAELLARLGNALGMSMADAAKYLLTRGLDDVLRSRLFGTRLG
jgi:hypothetical protein